MYTYVTRSLSLSLSSQNLGYRRYPRFFREEKGFYRSFTFFKKSSASLPSPKPKESLLVEKQGTV